MAEINAIDLYNKKENQFWRGMAHNSAIVKRCLKHMCDELTSDITDKVINGLQHDRDDKEKYSQTSKKKHR